MPKYGYLIVEGPHDVEFVYRLLSPFGLKRVQKLDELDIFFHPTVPRQYPPEGDLQKRMPIPLFLQSDTHAISIHSAVGDSRLVAMIEENAALINLNDFTGIGILLDSDEEITLAQRYNAITVELKNKTKLELADQPGIVKQSAPNLGAFVLPDNNSPGTLEDLLIKSAEHVYTSLLSAANTFVNSSSNADIDLSELREFNKPSGEKKAIVGAMANILKPGKAMQVSIQDNKWLKGDALDIPEIKAVQDFLKELFEID